MTQKRSKLWYLKNLDIFRYLADEEYKLLKAGHYVGFLTDIVFLLNHNPL